MQFVVTKHELIIQIQQIARSRKASTICIHKYLLDQIAREIMLLLVYNVYEQTSQKDKRDKILKACARYL